MDPAAFLKLATPVSGTKRFAIGLYERNVTLFRQQIRALNLIYSLRECSRESSQIVHAQKLVVIGGGAFGLTAAAAAAYVGFQVRLFERHQVLMPMQRGCDTRWVNPRYYEWPAPGSESPYAGLPLLNWRAGTAGDVAEQIERGFNKAEENTGRIQHFVGTRNLSIREERRRTNAEKTYLLNCDHDGGHEEWRADAIIYATGLGVEEDQGKATKPYWRNDNLAQADLAATDGNAISYTISGVGDGALTDLARLTIIDFRHDRIFKELYEDMDGSLKAELLQIADRSMAKQPSDWLYTAFEQLDAGRLGHGMLDSLRARVGSRLRRDTRVTLNGQESAFRDALSLRKVSLSNALLAYVLHKLGAFEYVPGKLSWSKEQWKIASGASSHQPEGEVIVRHGTKRGEPLKHAGFEVNEAALRLAARSVDTAQRIFPAGWWTHNQVEGEGKVETQVAEFVPPTTLTMATTFVSTIADVLSQALVKNDPPDGNVSDPQLRITLHRVIQIGEQEVFQQISPYRGIVLRKQYDGVGRVFPISGGMVGLAVRTGKPIVYRKEPEEFGKMQALTNFETLLAKPIEPHVDSMLAVPFFVRDRAGDPVVSFVLFADTSNGKFFEHSRLETVYAACKGFVSSLDDSLEAGRLTSTPTSYPGHRPSETIEKASAKEFATAGISIDDFHGYEQHLTFQNLVSTDLDDAVLF